jgi:uncharacterized membrane protein
MRLLTVSFAVACAVLAGCMTTPAAEPSAIPDDGPPAALEAATIAGIYAEPIQLQNGRYVGQPFITGGASRPTLTLLPKPIALVDSDADGEREWLVVLAESSGGSGTFYYLAVMQQSGVGFRSRATVLIGDRVQIERISVDGATVRIDLLAAGGDDPACCPSEVRTKRWRWVDDDLHPVARFVGHLVYGHESREFVTCGGQRYWVADASGGDLRRTYEAMIGAPYQPLFVEVSGSRFPAPETAFAAAYEEQLRVTALYRVETEGPECALDLAGARFRASGVEPFWHVDVGSDRLRFSRLGQAPISVAIEAREAEGTRRIWRGQLDAGALMLTLEEGRCIDPMSGSVFAYSATLSLDGRAFYGCALAPLPDRSEQASATSR